MENVDDELSHLRTSLFDQNRNGTFVRKDSKKVAKYLLMLGIINLSLGFSTLISYLSTYRMRINYVDNIEQEIFLRAGEYNVFITLEDVFQNYLGYTKSISFPQLKGRTNANLSETAPYDYSKALPYYPAGAIAYTYFTDEIEIENVDINSDGISREAENRLIGINRYASNEISIPDTWNKNTNRGTTPLNGSTSGIPILNERFANWISLAFNSNFNKLWGTIDLEEDGHYRLKVLSNYGFTRKKSILINEKSSLGIPNIAAAIILLSIGMMSFMASSYIAAFGY